MVQGLRVREAPFEGTEKGREGPAPLTRRCGAGFGAFHLDVLVGGDLLVELGVAGDRFVPGSQAGLEALLGGRTERL